MKKQPVSDHYRAADLKAVRRVQSWLGSGRTKAALARASGISTGTVSQVLSRQYPSSPTAHLEAMAAAIERERKRASIPAEIPYTETSVARLIQGVIRRAHEDRDFGIFAGRVGVGKTVALRRYAEDHPGVALFLEAYPGAGAPVILRMLASRLGTLGRRRTVADLTASLVDTLQPSDRVILVDEAETLTDQALLHLRRISDAARIGIVLAGTPALVGLVQDPDGKFGQISSRIGLWPPVCQSILEADATALTESYLGKSPEAETRSAIWSACQGSARALRNLLRSCRRWCHTHQVRLDAEVVQKVDRHAMGGRRLTA